MKSRTWMWTTVVYLFAALAMPVGWQRKTTHRKNINQSTISTSSLIWGPLADPRATPWKMEQPGHGCLTIGNARGVGGYSYFRSLRPNLYNLRTALSVTRFRWDDGVLTELGRATGVNSSAGYSLNERGWIVGFSQNGAIDPLTGFPENRAVLWTDDQTIDLGTLGGIQSTSDCRL